MELALLRVIVLLGVVLHVCGQRLNPNRTERRYTWEGQDWILDPSDFTCEINVTHGHTCSFGCNKFTWDRTQFCHCDDECTEYQDCCPDFEQYCKGNDQRPGHQHMFNAGMRGMFGGLMPRPGQPREETTPEPTTKPPSKLDEYTKCIPTMSMHPTDPEPLQGHFVVALCPPDWPGDPAVRRLCHESGGLLSLPVEGPKDQHYKNVYCAMCHGVGANNMTFWSMVYERDFDYRPSQTNFTSHFGHTSKRPYRVNPPMFNEPQVEESLRGSRLRSCVVHEPGICPDTVDAETRAICANKYAPIRFGNTTYKNLACYRCWLAANADDDVNITAQIFAEHCVAMYKMGQTTPRDPMLSLAMLFVFRDHANLVRPGATTLQSNGVQCASHQVYDPFENFCRDLDCTAGFAMSVEGRCLRSQPARPLQRPRPGLSLPVELAEVDVSLAVAGHLQDGPLLRPTGRAGDWREIAHRAADDYVSRMSACSGGGSGDDGGQEEEKTDTGCDRVNLTWACDGSGFSQVSLGSECGTGGAFSCIVNVSFKTSAASMAALPDDIRRAADNCLHGDAFQFASRVDALEATAACASWPQPGSPGPGPQGPAAAVARSLLALVYDGTSGEFLVSRNDVCNEAACPLLTFTRNEFTMEGTLNDSLRLTGHGGRLLGPGEFWLNGNGEAEVCNFLQAVPVSGTSLSVSLQVILTVSGSSLSLVGLLATTITYVTFPTLRRNVAGKSLMCLVISLFFAQLTMLIGLTWTDLVGLCVAFGITSHYAWLAAFVWMNILAIDIYRTFGLGTRITDLGGRYFRYYAIYGLSAPAAVVGACAALSFCDCAWVEVHYASPDACWIGGATANLVAFGVPIAAILTANAMLFSLTVAGVVKTRRASSRMNITQGQGDSATKMRNDIILYLKLTAIMGFTWVFGFVASFSGIQFFWYPFIALNSLQGALIYLAFVCNQRVLAMWRAKLKGGDLSDPSVNTPSSRNTK